MTLKDGGFTGGYKGSSARTLVQRTAQQGWVFSGNPALDFGVFQFI